MTKTLAEEAKLKMSKADLQTAVEDYLNRRVFQHEVSVSDIKYIATGTGQSSYQDIVYEIHFAEVDEEYEVQFTKEDQESEEADE